MLMFEYQGRVYINTTPHNVNLIDPATGQEFAVPPCGVLINARPVEEPAGIHPSGVELVRTSFVADASSEAKLKEMETAYPGAVIIGSVIAAQAFPGRVLGMIPAPGFERVPPDQKKMRADKFTSY